IGHGGRRGVDLQHHARVQHVGGGQVVALEQVGATDAVMFGQAPDRVAARDDVGARRGRVGFRRRAGARSVFRRARVEDVGTGRRGPRGDTGGGGGGGGVG